MHATCIIYRRESGVHYATYMQTLAHTCTQTGTGNSLVGTSKCHGTQWAHTCKMFDVNNMPEPNGEWGVSDDGYGKAPCAQQPASECLAQSLLLLIRGGPVIFHHHQ